jgi:hypothetical protein
MDAITTGSKTMPLPEAAELIGRAYSSGRRDAQEHGLLIDRPRRDDDTDLNLGIPVEGGGTGRSYLVFRADLEKFRRLMWVEVKNDRDVPEVSSVASKRTLGLAIYLAGGTWLGIGEVDALRKVAAERPDLCAIYETGLNNRVEVVVYRERELREAVSEAWRS